MTTGGAAGVAGGVHAEAHHAAGTAQPGRGSDPGVNFTLRATSGRAASRRCFVSSSESHIVCGFHATGALLGRCPGEIVAIWVDERRRDARMSALLQQAAAQGVATEHRPRAELDRLAAGTRHQGVVALCRGADSGAAADLNRYLATRAGDAFLLVLDGVQDPHNLGACLRSAEAAGAHGVVVPRDRACPLTPAVRRVAAGAAESLPVYRVTNLARVLEALKGAGVWVVGLSDAAGREIYDADLSGPLALVLGAEGRGLRRLTGAHCDELVRIPMAGAVPSLNVSVAAGVALFEAKRQRGG